MSAICIWKRMDMWEICIKQNYFHGWDDETLSGIKKGQKKMVRKNENVLFSYLIEKKDETYNSINNPEIFTLEIELLAPIVRV